MATVNSRFQKILLLTGKFPSPKKVEFIRLDEIAVKRISLKFFYFSCAKLFGTLMHYPTRRRFDHSITHDSKNKGLINEFNKFQRFLLVFSNTVFGLLIVGDIQIQSLS